jgi:uncharacterized membrane protein
MDYCTDSMVLIALDYLKTAITAYYSCLAACGPIAIVILVLCYFFPERKK